MNVLITQSNYIPWKGYFDSIALTDTFVVYDDMQYTKRDWRNRNLIKTESGLKWLSIPVEVKGKFDQKIKDTKISDNSWTLSHLDNLKQNYKKAACYKEVNEWVEGLYRNCKFEYITEVNVYFIKEICSFLQIDCNIRFSNEFELHEERTQRLVNICVKLGADTYSSGPAAKAYMEEQRFADAGIAINYFDHSGYKEYQQLNPPFEHGVTILDLIYNEGSNARSFLKY
ncbi:MAG TPA: WbqC family protein [Flavobacterium sp.]|jgi:uncharacterized protein YeeX (DUF496 family)|nr:WbqC family protein [Flavobacterium sp.]